MRKIDRFLQYLDYKGITENKATVDCDLSKGLLGQAKSGKSDLGNKTIEKVLSFYQDLSRVWLLTGTGSMLKDSTQNANPVEEMPRLKAEHIPQLSNTEIVLRDMLAEERARVDTLNEIIWELKEENGKLKALLGTERKGGVAANAGFSSAADAV